MDELVAGAMSHQQIGGFTGDVNVKTNAYNGRKSANLKISDVISHVFEALMPSLIV
jgi:hypothetical protein